MLILRVTVSAPCIWIVDPRRIRDQEDRRRLEMRLFDALLLWSLESLDGAEGDLVAGMKRAGERL